MQSLLCEQLVNFINDLVASGLAAQGVHRHGQPHQRRASTGAEQGVETPRAHSQPPHDLRVTRQPADGQPHHGHPEGECRAAPVFSGGQK